MASAVQEAAEAKDCILDGGEAWYFRNLGSRTPKHLHPGCNVFYVEDGFIRGFVTVACITNAPEMICSTTGRHFGEGVYAVMDARTWVWIDPIPMHGFQGWRYTDLDEGGVEIIGDWLAPKPEPVY